MKDGGFSDAETSSDDYFSQLPREFLAKRYTAEAPIW
jgi:hypothetical protein